jgi:glycerol-3-phosphate dehydrogenase (NAD(P)+)
MKVLVLGAGAWGTAVALSAADRHEVSLWARDGRQAAELFARRENLRYLPGFPLPAALALLSGPAAELPGLATAHDLVIVATPMAGLRAMLSTLRDCQRPVAWLC